MARPIGLFAGLVCVFVTGCASEPPSPFGKDAVARLKLQSISVVAAPDAQWNWGNAEQEFVEQQKSVPDPGRKTKIMETGALSTQGSTGDGEYAAMVASAEGKAYVAGKATARLKSALDQTLLPELQSGTQPVVLEIKVHQFSVPSAVQRVIIGGAPVVVASAELKDAATGAVLASRPRYTAAAFAGNGWGGVLVDQALDDLDVRVTRNFAESYRDWLLDRKNS